MLKASAVDLIRLSTEQAGALLQKTAAAVLPTGSVEQHGPHLPCGTDFIAAYLIGEEVARRCNALFVPFCPLGVTPFHQAFPGTITLSPGTYALLLQEVMESLARHGARRCIVVNWHEGNSGAIHIAADAVQKTLPLRVYIAQAAYVAQTLFGQEAGLTHGGLLEILPVRAYDPSLVRTELAAPPPEEERSRRIDALRRRRTVYFFPRDVREIAPEGWYGVLDVPGSPDPHEFIQSVASAIVEQLAEVAAALGDPFPWEGASHGQGEKSQPT